MADSDVFAAYKKFGIDTLQDRSKVGAALVGFVRAWGEDSFFAALQLKTTGSRVQTLVTKMNEGIVKLTDLAPELSQDDGSAISIERFFLNPHSRRYVGAGASQKLINHALVSDFCVVHAPLVKNVGPTTPADFDHGVPDKLRHQAKNTTTWDGDVEFGRGSYSAYSHLGLHLDVKSIRKNPIWPITPQVVQELFYRPQLKVPRNAVFNMLVAGAVYSAQRAKMPEPA